MAKYVDDGYHAPLFVDGDIVVAGDYVDSGYYIDGYTEGSTPIRIDVGGAVKFFVKKNSTKTKDEIVSSVLATLAELSKEIAVVSDLRAGAQYVVVVASKQAEISSGNSFIDIVGGGVSVEIIQA